MRFLKNKIALAKASADIQAMQRRSVRKNSTHSSKTSNKIRHILIRREQGFLELHMHLRAQGVSKISRKILLKQFAPLQYLIWRFHT